MEGNRIGTTIGSDAGFNILGLTSAIKTSITNSLKVSESHTKVQMTEQTETNEINNPFKTSLEYAKYILVNKYVLVRTDGSQAGSWIVSDNNTIQHYFLSF
ncbi:hypothetical protein BLGI_701 [Brevibacillus laterosporus GI-9]|nr:hypothetical protein BLGI_701 [Brevibacillus laterosporus GI-9]